MQKEKSVCTQAAQWFWFYRWSC